MTRPITLTLVTPEEDICTSCGMCCDGTLFAHVEVTEDERSTLKGLFSLEAGKDGPIFCQPCPHNVEHKCVVYDDRPETCRSYRCKTLSAFQAGEITHHEAARRVRETLDARERLQPLLEPDETVKMARIRRAAAAANPSRARVEMAFILKSTALDMILDRYFRKRGKTMLFPD